MNRSSEQTAAGTRPLFAADHAATEFALAASAARRELLRANEHAESMFYKTLRDTTPGDALAIADAQAKLDLAIAEAREQYGQTLANAEKAYLPTISPATAGAGATHAVAGPLSALVRRLATERSTALAHRLTFGLHSGFDTARASAADPVDQ